MSNLILLQYTKEISIFAASFDYRLQLYNMKKITGKTYLDWYENMLLWRKFEDKLAAKYIQQKIRGFLHLYNGQEAVLAGCLHSIDPKKDRMISSYRSHVHAIGLGEDPKFVMAELFGKATGTSGGLGGSMHIFSKKYNFSLSRPTTLTIFLVPLSFLIVALVRQNSFLSTYTYKSSSYIWTLSIFFLGVLIYDNFEFDKFLIYLLNPILVIAYLFQVFAIPEFISNFFTTLGDKFEPHKGSDLTLLFVVTFMLNGKFFRTNKNYYAFLSIFSALYLPFLYFKSRASFIAVFLFLIYEIIKNRK